MKIVFFGTPDFSVESLDAIIKAGHEVAAVVTMPDKPAGRGHHLFQSPVKLFALEHNIPVLQPEKLKDEQFINALKAIDAPLFVVIAFRMLPEMVWSMPALGTFNLHASLLPKYRGAAPINWAIINGDSETGVTTFFLQHEIDTGDIIDQEKISISPDENVGSVHDRLVKLGADLTVKTINAIAKGVVKTLPQNAVLNGATPTPAPKIFRETCMIDWHKPAQEVHNLIRGLSPYPAAWSFLNSSQIKVFSSKILSETTNLTPGEFVVKDNRMIVGCGHNTSLEILEIQLQGKRRMPISDYLRGARMISFGKLG